MIPFSSTIPFGQYPSNNSNSFLNPIGFPNIQNELKPIPNPSALITNTPPFITNTNPFFSDLSSFSSNSITPESQTFPPFLQIQNNLQLSTLPMTTNLIETSSVSTQESENSFPLSQEQEEQDDSNQSFQFSQSIPSLPQTLPHESNSETKFIDQQPNLVIHLDSESSDEEGEDSPIRSRKVEIVKSSKSKSPSPSVSEEKANSRGSSPFPIGIDRQKEILKLKQIIAQKEKEKKLKQMTEKKRKEIEETKKHLEEKPTPTSSNGNDKEEENLSVTAPPEKKQKPNDTATQAEKLKKLVVIQELKKKIEIQEKLLRQKQMENKTRESKISDCKDQLVDIQHRYSTTTSRLRIFQEQLQTIFDTLTVAEKEKTAADEKLNALNSAQNQRKQKLLSLKRKLESEKLRLKELEIEMKTIQYFKGKSNDRKETNPTKEKATFNLSLSNDNSIKLPSTHSNIQSLTVFRPIKVFLKKRSNRS